MNRFTRWLSLTASDWRLLIAASLVQVLTAFGLRTMSLPTLRRGAARLRLLAHFILRGPEARVIWAIEASGRRLAGVSTCLVRAIVADLALGSPERPLRLTVGVRYEPGGRLQSHAWLADRDRIVIGGSTADQYAPLTVWDSLFA
ncbi:MAG: hypothetical protein A3G76_05765 [Acidobacteria bacterium RIFCSPLOWO2_12_FULL_65_11]|nr:MAG: hypothetical protein A3H95_02955 [Acidobacteria bacterium RIFCSPLOWO2_02_FULL_64_15]OFW29388.1 MAG: hypothetical protein A3G76_05765 [Acidobacteria bacterium RIFCSPLOWO2_12_FULL_65_11]